LKNAEEDHTIGKGKEKARVNESAPITRQGYRSGQLAEDFWKALGTPNTPQTHRKRLKVIPFLLNQAQTEYLSDRKAKPCATITTVQVAELLAGIPWTTTRARLHVVNEVAQSLHKVLIFNNTSTSPFQKWTQGAWYAQWTHNLEGEHTCTLYAHITVSEQKIKIRRGKNLEWRKLPEPILALMQEQPKEDIQNGPALEALWRESTADKGNTQTLANTVTTQNPYSVLNQEEDNTSLKNPCP
jgi:hypothetical protein